MELSECGVYFHDWIGIRQMCPFHSSICAQEFDLCHSIMQKPEFPAKSLITAQSSKTTHLLSLATYFSVRWRALHFWWQLSASSVLKTSFSSHEVSLRCINHSHGAKCGLTSYCIIMATKGSLHCIRLRSDADVRTESHTLIKVSLWSAVIEEPLENRSWHESLLDG